MDNTFPARLKELREQRGISRKTLSELCGLAHDAVRRYERRQAVPTMPVLVTLAEFFDVSIDYLVGRDEKK